MKNETHIEEISLRGLRRGSTFMQNSTRRGTHTCVAQHHRHSATTADVRRTTSRSSSCWSSSWSPSSSSDPRQQKNNIVDNITVDVFVVSGRSSTNRNGPSTSFTKSMKTALKKRQRPQHRAASEENILKSDLFSFIFFSGNRKKSMKKM